MRFARAVSDAKLRRVLAGHSRTLKNVFPVPVEPRPTSPTLFAKGVFETSKHRNSGSGVRFARAVSDAKLRRVLAGHSRMFKNVFPVPVEPRPTSPTLFAKGVFETSKHRNSGSGVRLARGVSHAKPRRSLAGHCRPLKTIFSVPAEPLPTSLTLFAKRVSKDRTMKTVARECDSRGLSLTPSCDACLPDTPECSKTFFQLR